MDNFEEYVRFEFIIIFNIFTLYFVIVHCKFLSIHDFPENVFLELFTLYTCKLNVQTVYFVYEKWLLCVFFPTE